MPRSSKVIDVAAKQCSLHHHSVHRHDLKDLRRVLCLMTSVTKVEYVVLGQ